MEIRPARFEEAEEISLVLRRSITELCVDDHRHEERVLSGWLASKTSETVGTWVNDSAQLVLVAIVDGRVAGVGAALRDGEILLNYVHPDFRFLRVSKALLHALETWLTRSGCGIARLTSTATARRFYLSAGYVPDGDPIAWRGGKVFPLRKAI